MTSYLPRTSSMQSSAKSFNIMFRIVCVFITLTFVAAIVMVALVFTGNAPFNYHYEVSYGNGGYSETETWGNK